MEESIAGTPEKGNDESKAGGPAGAFNLAYHRMVNTEAGPLVYVLVPADLGRFSGVQHFDAVDQFGKPFGAGLFANRHQLQPLRSPYADEGVSPVEQVLIGTLEAEARRRGLSLPEIQPTTSWPAWTAEERDK